MKSKITVVISYSVDQENKFCLNNQLLWAHYADKHKGMVSCFEIDDKNVDQLFPVRYSEITPMLDFEERSNFEEVLRTKVCLEI
ncbi:MAG: hypothetical protein IPJ32_09405 [Sphingobacteriaceae bacterium]|nr:hypothetical protein [Sphingobacteriaceae bacterium]